MKTALLGILLALFQPQAAQNGGVFRLPQNSLGIPGTAGGRTVELLNSPSHLGLPRNPPANGPHGGRWFVDVKNLGPKDVTLNGTNGFTALVHVNETIRIRAVGNVYMAARPQTH